MDLKCYSTFDLVGRQVLSNEVVSDEVLSNAPVQSLELRPARPRSNL